MNDSMPEKVSNDNTGVKDVEKNEAIPQIRYDIPFSEKHSKYQTFHLLKRVQLFLAILILIFELVQVIEFEAYFQDFKKGFDYIPSANTVYFRDTPFGKGPVAIWNYIAIVFTIVILTIYLIDIERVLPHTKHVVFIAFERAVTTLWIVETFTYLIWAYNIEESPCYSDYPVYYYSPTRLDKVIGSPYRRQVICGAYITATTLSWLMLAAVSASTAVAWLLHDSENDKLSWPLFMLSALIPKFRDLFYTPQQQKLDISPPLMGPAADEIKTKSKTGKDASRKSRNSTSPRTKNSTSPRSSKSLSPPSWMAPAAKMATNIASHITSAARHNNNSNNNDDAYIEVISNIPVPQHENTTAPVETTPEPSDNNVATEIANNNTPSISVIPVVDNDTATQESAPAQSNNVPIENTGSQIETAHDTSTPEPNNDVPVEKENNATSA